MPTAPVTPDSAHRRGPTDLIARRARSEVDRIAAQAVSLGGLALGLTLLLATLLTGQDPEGQSLRPARLVMAMLLVGAAATGALLQRRGHARTAIGLQLVILLSGLPTVAVIGRLGLQSIALAGAALAVALVGGLLSLRAAAWLSAAQAGVLWLLYRAHLDGLLPNVHERSPSALLVSHLLVLAAGLVSGLLLARLFGNALQRALGEAGHLGELVRLGADWTYSLDSRGRPLEISASFEQHTGQRAADFLRLGEPGAPALRLDAQGRQLWRHFTRRRAFRNLPCTFDLPGDRWLAVQCSGEPQHDEAGRFVGWWGVCRDVTRQVLAEQELASARARAEAASQAKGAFLATVSHEIRTPINGVRGLTQMLRGLPPDAHAQREELLGLLERSAGELTELVTDVLDLSRLEAGKLDLRPAPLDPRRLAEACFLGPAVMGRERGLDMRLSLADDLPPLVMGDAVRLRQVLANLLGNALKFTEQGGIVLRAERLPDGLLRFEVCDTGIGIAATDRARLFQRFEQADNSSTRRHGGSGLGLSICAELTELMGGRISVHEHLPGGSCFRVDLPLPEATAPRQTPGGADPRRLDGMCLLLVEDTPVNMLVASALLRGLGATVLEAWDGPQALALARAEPERIDAVLMDLHMPGMDGYETALALRSAPATAHLPVVALSAAVLEAERERASAAGMRDFIGKPIDADELRRALAPFRRG